MLKTDACPLPAGERILSKLDRGIGGVPSASLWTGSAAAAGGGLELENKLGIASGK